MKSNGRGPSRSVIGACAALGLGALLLSPAVRTAGASSHREAPLISQDPNADNTDLYAFVSPDRPDTVTIVANYIPLEEPAGGPNFAAFGDDVLYAINIDNDGDGEEDIQYRFRFKTTIRNPNSFLYDTGPIASLNDPNWNMPQTYTPDYEALAVTDLPGGIKVFAGQRDDPFFVDLGSVFDLAGLRPFNGAHLIPLDPGPGVDGVGGFNTHSIVIQVPIDQLTRSHRMPSGPDDPTAVIGVYASASRKRVRILRDDGTDQQEASWVQVSRLGEPLLVVGIGASLVRSRLAVALGDHAGHHDHDHGDPGHDHGHSHLPPDALGLAEPLRARRVGRAPPMPVSAGGDAGHHLARPDRLRPRAHRRLLRRAGRRARRHRPRLRLRAELVRPAAGGRPLRALRAGGERARHLGGRAPDRRERPVADGAPR